MQIIRFELDGVLDKTAGKTVEAFVGDWSRRPNEGKTFVHADGNADKPVYVTDAFGIFEGKGGGPGVRGSVGYAVWMADSQRFEVLSLV